MKEKRTAISVIVLILKYVMLIFAAFIALVPVCVCILTAFKTTDEYNNTSVLALPKSFVYFENFKVAFQQANMLRGFLNTGLVLIVVLVVSVFVGSMLAYVLNRFKFRGNAVIQNLERAWSPVRTIQKVFLLSPRQ